MGGHGESFACYKGHWVLVELWVFGLHHVRFGTVAVLRILDYVKEIAEERNGLEKDRSEFLSVMTA